MCASPRPAGVRLGEHLVAARDVRITRTGAQAQATHVSFDNDIDTLTAVIERIAGRMIAPMEWLDY